MKSLSRIATLGLGAALVSALALAADEAPQVGDKAPEFSLMGTDGKTHSLSDYKGKKAVVVAWFPKAFTKGCIVECKAFAEKSDVLKSMNVAYFTASVDDADTNKKFAESLHLESPILSDPEKTVAKGYGVLNARGMANRWTFYIDKEGVIREIDKKILVEKAPEDVATKLKELKIAD